MRRSNAIALIVGGWIVGVLLGWVYPISPKPSVSTDPFSAEVLILGPGGVEAITSVVLTSPYSTFTCRTSVLDYTEVVTCR